MKQFKFLMVAFSLLMGVSLTSCLNSSGTDSTTRYAIGKVYSSLGSYYFKTADGYTITPTYASISSALASGNDLSKYVGEVVFFVYDAADATVDAASKTISDVKYGGCASLNNAVEVVNGTPDDTDKAINDSIENTPIISLAGTNDDKPAFYFDNYTLYLPANYTMAKTENYVSLVYYTEEEADNDGVVRLHLRYNSKGSTVSPSITSYNYYVQTQLPYFYVKFYDLSNVFAAYNQGAGATYPTKVEIVAKENPYSTDLEDAQTAEKIYTVEYSPSN